MLVPGSDVSVVATQVDVEHGAFWRITATDSLCAECVALASAPTAKRRGTQEYLATSLGGGEGVEIGLMVSFGSSG